MSDFITSKQIRLQSAPVVPAKRCRLNNSKLIISENKLDENNVELCVNMIYPDGFMCQREIKVKTSPNHSNYMFIKHTLEKISHVLLIDPHFKNLSVEFNQDQVYLKMVNGKIINITAHIESIDLGLYILNQIMADDKLPLNDVCPILHDNIQDLLDKGEKLVRIDGEPHIYHAEALEEALNYSGLNISPMTRQPIKKLIPVVKVDKLDLPLKLANAPEVVQIENKLSEPEPEVKSNPMDVTIVVDVSFSMGQCVNGTNMAYDPLKKYIKSLAKGSFIKIITFSNDYEVSFDLADKDTLDLDSQLNLMLKPRGGTAFRDAMIQTINEFKNNDNDRKHLLFVITDGIDYDSKSSIDELNLVTKTAWSEDGKNIDCLFMHPPQLDGPSLLKLPEDNCLTFHPDPKYTEAAIASLRQVSNNYSCGQAVTITPLMRQVSCPANYLPGN